jgi:hypothetical protein
MLLNGSFENDGTFKRRLKPDAAPNVPLASPDPEKKNGRDYNMQNLMYTPRDRLIVVSCEKGGNMMTYMYF